LSQAINSTIRVGYSTGWRRWVLCICTAILLTLSTTSLFDRRASDDHDKLFQRALVTFALARTLNGVISAIQGTELALTPAGVGVTLTPGQILDPVNDLVERFSWIMLGATVSLGVQQVLLEAGQWWVLKMLVIILGISWLWLHLSSVQRQRSRQILVKAFAIAIFIRFAVPAALIANEVIYEQFLESRYQTSTEMIESAGEEFESVTGHTPSSDTDGELESEEAGVMDSIQQALANSRKSLDLEYQIERISEKATEIFEHVIQLSVVFVLQTCILPIAFLWLFLHLIKSLSGFRQPQHSPWVSKV
jgi:hypothetical protein